MPRMPPPSIARTRIAPSPYPRRQTLTRSCQGSLGLAPCAITWPPCALASSSSTAAWARRSRSSTSRSSDYGGLAGKCHEALVLNRPDVIEGVHSSMVEAGAEVVETDTFQASRLKLEEWGLAEHTLEINRKAAEIARKAVGEERFVAGSIGPTGHLPASDDPTLGKIRFRELVEIFAEQARGPARGRRRPAHHRDRAGHPRGQGRDLRRPRGVQAARPHACRSRRSVSLLPNGGKMLLGHRHRRGPDDARGAQGRRHRPELLDRPRGHARRDPLPRRELAASRSTASRTPACRSRAPTARRSSRRSPSRWPTSLGEFVERYGVSIVGGCCGTTPDAHRGDRRALRAAARSASAPPPRPPRVELDDRPPTPLVQEPRADARRRARQLAGLAQGQGAAARRRLRRPRPDRRGPGRGRRARARPLRRADRAHRRGRADARRSPSASR